MIKLGRWQVCALVFAGLLAAPAHAAIDRWSPWGPPVGPNRQLLLDPIQTTRLYLLSGEPFQGGSVYTSFDGGTTWEWAGRGLGSARVDGLVQEPDGRLWALTDDEGLWRSDNHAGSWQRVSPALPCDFTTNPDERFRHFDVGRSTPRSFFATCGNELVVSQDGGAMWVRRSLPGAPRGLVVDPVDGSRVLLFDGFWFWISTDGGATWGAPAAAPVGATQGRLLPALGGSPTVFFFSVDGVGLFRSSDGGVSWALVLPAAVAVPALAFDSVDPSRMAALSGALGAPVELQCSADAGVSFSRCADVVPNVDSPVGLAFRGSHGPFYVATTRALAVGTGSEWSFQHVAGSHFGGTDAVTQVPGRTAWVVAGHPFVGDGVGLSWRASGLLPRRGAFLGASLDVALDPRDFNRGLAVEERWLLTTSNAGEVWETRYFLPFVDSVLIFPSGTHLAAGCAVRHSSDGIHWTQTLACDLVNNRGLNAVRLVRDSRRPRTVFAFTTTSWRQRATVFRLQRSHDEGRTWGSVRDGVSAFALDPTRTGTLYAVVGGKLQRSTDDGRTWRVRSTLAAANKPIPDLVVDPHDGNHLLALVRGVGVLRSRDGGVTWAAADLGLGPNHKWLLRRLLADTNGARRFYVMTDAGGYWIQFTD